MLLARAGGRLGRRGDRTGPDAGRHLVDGMGLLPPARGQGRVLHARVPARSRRRRVTRPAGGSDVGTVSRRPRPRPSPPNAPGFPHRNRARRGIALQRGSPPARPLPRHRYGKGRGRVGPQASPCRGDPGGELATARVRSSAATPGAWPISGSAVRSSQFSIHSSIGSVVPPDPPTARGCRHEVWAPDRPWRQDLRREATGLRIPGFFRAAEGRRPPWFAEYECYGVLKVSQIVVR